MSLSRSRTADPIDLAVVGSGLLGLLVADLAARAGRQVTLFDSGEVAGGIPRRDSQRSHTWLQSGLLYASELGVPFAMRMWAGGTQLLEHVGMSRPKDGGIFRFGSDAAADAFKSLAAECRLDHLTRDLKQSDAEAHLGPLYVPGQRHFSVPDAPFPTSEVLHKLYRRAHSTGTRFVAEHVEPERHEDSIVLRTAQGLFLPDSTVLCAGCGTPALLEVLGLTHPLAVFRSPLLRIYAGPPPDSLARVNTNLLVDRSSGLAVVRVPVTDAATSCLIVGDRSRERLSPNQAQLRQVTNLERQTLVNLLPSQLEGRAKQAPATAGHKTEALEKSIEKGSGTAVAESSSVRPWIRRFDNEGLPRLLAAVPGKATLAFFAAREVVARLPISPSWTPPSPSGSTPANPDFRYHAEFPGSDESSRSSQ